MRREANYEIINFRVVSREVSRFFAIKIFLTRNHEKYNEKLRKKFKYINIKNSNLL